MPTAISESQRAAGWRWSPQWHSWLCPVSHLISDAQVAQMAAADNLACPLCHYEALDRDREQQRAERRRDERARADARRYLAEQSPAFRIPADQTTFTVTTWFDTYEGVGRPTPKQRKPKAKPEPEPRLVSKGRRYNFED